MFVNLVSAPFLIRKAKSKMKEVLSNVINSSYSQISVNILMMVVLQEYLVIGQISFTWLYYIYLHTLGFDKVFVTLFYISKVLSFTVEFMNDVLLMSQVFEWTIMWFMAVFQNAKSLSAVMQHQLNTKVSYAGKEKIIKIGYYLFLLLLTIFLVSEIYDLFDSKVKISATTTTYLCYVEIILLSMSSSNLLYQLRNKYNFEYRK